MALAPPPDKFERTRSEGGPTGGSLKERLGGLNRNRNRSFFQSADGSKGPTEGKSNEANFDNGSFTLDGMRHE